MTEFIYYCEQYNNSVFVEFNKISMFDSTSSNRYFDMRGFFFLLYTSDTHTNCTNGKYINQNIYFVQGFFIHKLCTCVCVCVCIWWIDNIFILLECSKFWSIRMSIEKCVYLDLQEGYNTDTVYLNLKSLSAVGLYISGGFYF